MFNLVLPCRFIIHLNHIVETIQGELQDNSKHVLEIILGSDIPKVRVIDNVRIVNRVKFGINICVNDEGHFGQIVHHFDEFQLSNDGK
jgi:hypothetical protein